MTARTHLHRPALSTVTPNNEFSEGPALLAMASVPISHKLMVPSLMQWLKGIKGIHTLEVQDLMIHGMPRAFWFGPNSGRAECWNTLLPHLDAEVGLSSIGQCALPLCQYGNLGPPMHHSNTQYSGSCKAMCKGSRVSPVWLDTASISRGRSEDSLEVWRLDTGHHPLAPAL